MESCSHPELKDFSACSLCHLQQARLSSQRLCQRIPVSPRDTELSTKLSENLDQDETDRVMAELADVESKIDSGNLWELERVKTRAMDALRCPPPDANVDVLSGTLLLLKHCICNLTTSYLTVTMSIAKALFS